MRMKIHAPVCTGSYTRDSETANCQQPRSRYVRAHTSETANCQQTWSWYVRAHTSELDSRNKDENKTLSHAKRHAHMCTGSYIRDCQLPTANKHGMCGLIHQNWNWTQGRRAFTNTTKQKQEQKTFTRNTPCTHDVWAHTSNKDCQLPANCQQTHMVCAGSYIRTGLRTHGRHSFMNTNKTLSHAAHHAHMCIGSYIRECQLPTAHHAHMCIGSYMKDCQLPTASKHGTRGLIHQNWTHGRHAFTNTTKQKQEHKTFTRHAPCTQTHVQAHTSETANCQVPTKTHGLRGLIHQNWTRGRHSFTNTVHKNKNKRFSHAMRHAHMCIGSYVRDCQPPTKTRVCAGSYIRTGLTAMTPPRTLRNKKQEEQGTFALSSLCTHPRDQIGLIPADSANICLRQISRESIDFIDRKIAES